MRWSRDWSLTASKAEGWESAILSGNGAWATSWEPVHALATKQEGKGSWIICQLDLHNRTKINPVAKLLANRMLEPHPTRQMGSPP
ncbi:MAG: hypothetical protein EBY32_02880 [Proteobacteria bacterium]|nr:hypothetical protein [Pseudomonadota bacterium]